jgi:hypothetical protein
MQKKIIKYFQTIYLFIGRCLFVFVIAFMIIYNPFFSFEINNIISEMPDNIKRIDFEDIQRSKTGTINNKIVKETVVNIVKSKNNFFLPILMRGTGCRILYFRITLNDNKKIDVNCQKNYDNNIIYINLELKGAGWLWSDDRWVMKKFLDEVDEYKILTNYTENYGIKK